jgi:hypothetical protein
VLYFVYVISHKRAANVEAFEQEQRKKIIDQIEDFDGSAADTTLSPKDYGIYKQIIDTYNRVLDRQPSPEELFKHFNAIKSNAYDENKLKTMLLGSEEHDRKDKAQNNTSKDDIEKSINDQYLNDKITLVYMKENNNIAPTNATLAFLKEQYMVNGMNDDILVVTIRKFINKTKENYLSPESTEPSTEPSTSSIARAAETDIDTPSGVVFDTSLDNIDPEVAADLTEVSAKPYLAPVQKYNPKPIPKPNPKPIPKPNPTTVSMVVQRPNIFNIYSQKATEEISEIGNMISSLISGTQLPANITSQVNITTTEETTPVIKSKPATTMSKPAATMSKPAATMSKPAATMSKPEYEPEYKSDKTANKYPVYDPKDPRNIDNITNTCLDKDAMGANLDKRKENILADYQSSRNISELQFACDRAGGSCAKNAANTSTTSKLAKYGSRNGSHSNTNAVYDKSLTYGSVGLAGTRTGDANMNSSRPIYNNADNSGKLFPEYAWAVPQKILPEPPESIYGPIEQTALIGTLLTDAKNTNAGSIIKKIPLDDY